MHSAQYDPSLYAVRSNGNDANISAIFPDCDEHDRFGIVIHEPWGGLGASLLIQATICEFFRTKRAAGRRDSYPEVYAFHVGRDHGDMSMYDLWPYSKEVVVENNPNNVLLAINDRAITRLAVPVGALREHRFFWPERVTARDRIRSVVGYGANGKVPNPDFEIRATDELADRNTQETLTITDIIRTWRNSELPDIQRWIGRVSGRVSAVPPELTKKALEIHNAKMVDGFPVETYQKADISYAFGRLDY